VPVVVAEYGMIYVDLPMAALTVFGMAMLLYDKYLLAGVLLSLAVLIKLPAIFMLPCVMFFLWKKNQGKKNAWQGRHLLAVGLPAVVFGLWLVFHHSTMGWWLTKPELAAEVAPRSLNNSLAMMMHVMRTTLADQSRIVLLLMGAFGSLSLYRKKKFRNLSNLYTQTLLLWLVSVMGAFVFMYEFNNRYAIFIFPALTALCLYVVRVRYGYRGLRISGALISILFILSFRPNIDRNTPAFNAPKDMHYKDMIKIGAMAASFVESEYKEAIVFGDFPENYQLTEPYQGYVSEGIEFFKCDDFIKNDGRDQLIYVHLYTPGQSACHKLVKMNRVSLLREFESNDKWVKIFILHKST
jgi:hypothetical protein